MEALVEWTAPVRAELGIDVAPAGERRTAPSARWPHESAGADLRDVYASTVQETAETYGYGVAAEVKT